MCIVYVCMYVYVCMSNDDDDDDDGVMVNSMQH